MNTRQQSHGSRRSRAFSLIELLAVIALLGILATLVVPSIRGVSSATELSVSAASIVDTLNLARQTALSANRPVEVRLYEVPRSGDQTLAYRAVGVYLIGENGPTPVGRITFLRNNVVMADTDTFGTLLRGLPTGQEALRTVDPSGAKSFNYRTFTFRTDGSANLPRTTTLGGGDTWHLMLYDKNRPPVGNAAPANHVTVQLLPDTGRTRTFQPGAL
jgi:uncharacterized protein (TIGR02596 family)